MASSSSSLSPDTNKDTNRRISVQNKAILEEYWCRGMVSSSPGTTGGNLVSEAMEKTGLTKKTVQNFIGGKRKKIQLDSGLKKRTKPFKLSTAMKKKQPTEKQRLYATFQSQYMQGRGDEDKALMLKTMNEEWREKKTDPDYIDDLRRKMGERSGTTAMTARQKQAAVRQITLEIAKVCKYMNDTLEYETMFAACHMDHGTAMTGSHAGVGHMVKDDKRVMREFQFGVGRQDGTDKVARQFLLSQVQDIFNAKYESVTGKKRVEYTAWRAGKVNINVEGMPSGRCFTDPHRYSEMYLEKIVNAKDQLKFTVDYCVHDDEDGSMEGTDIHEAEVNRENQTSNTNGESDIDQDVDNRNEEEEVEQDEDNRNEDEEVEQDDFILMPPTVTNDSDPITILTEIDLNLSVPLKDPVISLKKMNVTETQTIPLRSCSIKKKRRNVKKSRQQSKSSQVD